MICHRPQHLHGADCAAGSLSNVGDRHNGDQRRTTFGYEPTRDAAMAAFARSLGREPVEQERLARTAMAMLGREPEGKMTMMKRAHGRARHE